MYITKKKVVFTAPDAVNTGKAVRALARKDRIEKIPKINKVLLGILAIVLGILLLQIPNEVKKQTPKNIVHAGNVAVNLPTDLSRAFVEYEEYLLETENGEEASKAEAETENGEEASKAEAETENGEEVSKAEAETENEEEASKAEAETENGEGSSKAEAETENGEEFSKAEAETENGEESSKAETRKRIGKIKTTKYTQTYKEKSKKSEVAYSVRKGATLYNYGVEGNWIVIMDEWKNYSYISIKDTDYKAEVKTEEKNYAIVANCTWVNFRKGPSINYSIKKAVANGTAYEILSKDKNGWLYVKELSTQIKGYINGKYLEKVSEAVAKKKKSETARKKQEEKADKSFDGVKLQYLKAYKIKSDALTPLMGTKIFNGHIESWYSEAKKPGGGLKIPGRHSNTEDGTVRDQDGYICVAADEQYLKKGTILMTSLGPAKVYDCGCDVGVIDIYVNSEWQYNRLAMTKKIKKLAN